MVSVDTARGAVAAPSLQGDDPAPSLGEGAASGESTVPASGSPTVQVTLILEAIVGVLQGVSVASPGLVRLQTGDQALQAGEKLLINTALLINVLSPVCPWSFLVGCLEDLSQEASLSHA